MDSHNPEWVEGDREAVEATGGCLVLVVGKGTQKVPEWGRSLPCSLLEVLQPGPGLV